MARKAKDDATPEVLFFDAGAFRAIRPQGPLDSASDLNGPALETILLHHHEAGIDVIPFEGLLADLPKLLKG